MTRRDVGDLDELELYVKRIWNQDYESHSELTERAWNFSIKTLVGTLLNHPKRAFLSSIANGSILTLALKAVGAQSRRRLRKCQCIQVFVGLCRPHTQMGLTDICGDSQREMEGP